MTTADFSSSFFFDQTPQEVFDSINQVTGWWSDDFKGESHKQDDVFEVRFADMHYSRQQLIAIIPGKQITWLVTDSYLSFLQNKTEWTGTTVDYRISTANNKTLLDFTHIGLLPGMECFNDCSKGWNYYLQSLASFINTGIGNPNRK